MIDLETVRSVLARTTGDNDDPYSLANYAAHIIPIILSEIEALRKVAESARHTVEHSLLYRIAGGLELSKALSDAGYGGGE